MMSKIQVLVTTMHQKDTSKYESMNLQTDAIIANQADDCFYTEEQKGEHTVKMITTNTRGLSVNRNIALMYATADYIMFADDDQVLIDGYEQVIEDEFKRCPRADAIKFYCESTNKDRPMSFKRPSKFHRVKKFEVMSSGVHCLIIKRECLLNNNLFYQSNLGSGAEIVCGEDTAFINDLLKLKIKLYASPTLLSYINQGESSWFKGYNEKYFTSIGYVYSRIYGKFALLAIYRRAYRLKNKTKDFTFSKMVKIMKKGMKKQRNKG